MRLLSDRCPHSFELVCFPPPLADIKNACFLAYKLVLFYGFSDLGITNFARQPYSSDFAIGSNRPRKLVSTEAMDEMADWPTRNEDFRFDPLDPSDLTWHRCVRSAGRGGAQGGKGRGRGRPAGLGRQRGLCRQGGESNRGERPAGWRKQGGARRADVRWLMQGLDVCVRQMCERSTLARCVTGVCEQRLLARLASEMVCERTI